MLIKWILTFSLFNFEKWFRSMIDYLNNQYHTTNNSYNDEGLNRTLSIPEIVRSKSRKENEFGIEGYWIPKYNAYLDKPLSRKWVKNALPDFYSEIKKRSQKTPSPAHYQK